MIYLVVKVNSWGDNTHPSKSLQSWRFVTGKVLRIVEYIIWWRHDVEELLALLNGSFFELRLTYLPCVFHEFVQKLYNNLHQSICVYIQASNLSLTLVDNKIVDHLDVVWASPSTSSFATSGFNGLAKTTARCDVNHASLGIWCAVY